MEKIKEYDAKKPFENWLRVSGSKLNVSESDFKRWPNLFPREECPLRSSILSFGNLDLWWNSRIGKNRLSGEFPAQ